MESTKSLPDAYIHHIDIRGGEYRKGHLLAFLISLPLAVGIYILFITLARLSRPEMIHA